MFHVYKITKMGGKNETEI